MAGGRDLHKRFLEGRTSEGITRTVEGNAMVLRADSWDAWLAYCEPKPAGGAGASEGGDQSFTQTASLGEALTLAREGWAEKRGDVSDLRDRVKADPTVGSIFDDYVTYPTTVHSVAGAFPDVAAFLTGDPECMIEFGEQDEPRSGRVVKIHVDGCYSGMTDTDLVIQRGAVVVALVELLETLGFSTEVVMESAVATSYDHSHQNGKGNILANVVTVKTAAMPLDVDALMFALAHPSTLRRLVFRSNEHEHDDIRAAFHFGGRFGGGYGSVTKPVTAESWGAHVVLHSASHNRPESRNPSAWIREIVEGLFLPE